MVLLSEKREWPPLSEDFFFGLHILYPVPYDSQQDSAEKLWPSVWKITNLIECPHFIDEVIETLRVINKLLVELEFEWRSHEWWLIQLINLHVKKLPYLSR